MPCMEAKNLEYEYTILYLHDVKYHNLKKITTEDEKILFDGSNKYLSLTNSSKSETPYLNFPVESESCKVRIWMDELEYGAERVEIFIEPIENNE